MAASAQPMGRSHPGQEGAASDASGSNRAPQPHTADTDIDAPCPRETGYETHFAASRAQ